MATAIAVIEDNNHSSTYTDAENLARRIMARVASMTAKLKDLEDDIRQLWVEFDNLKTGETILGCATKAEFCEKKLHRTPQAVRYMLNPELRVSKQCLLPESSETVSPQQESVELTPQTQETGKINKHLVDVQLGDVLGYNTSSGTYPATVIEINPDCVKIQTGKTGKSIKTLPLTIDTQTIRSNASKAQREPDYTRHTGREGHCGKCRDAGLPNGKEACFAGAPALDDIETAIFQMVQADKQDATKAHLYDAAINPPAPVPARASEAKPAGESQTKKLQRQFDEIANPSVGKIVLKASNVSSGVETSMGRYDLLLAGVTKPMLEKIRQVLAC